MSMLSVILSHGHLIIFFSSVLLLSSYEQNKRFTAAAAVILQLKNLNLRFIISDIPRMHKL